MNDYRTAQTIKSVKVSKILNQNKIANKYVLGRRLSKPFKDIFFTSVAGKDYVVKLVEYSDYKLAIYKKIYDMVSEYLLPIYDYGVENDYIYIVHPYMKNGSLLDDMRCIGNDNLVVKVAKDVNEGLKVFHKSGIAHGDIKPANLFWNETGDGVVIGDYDIAAFLGDVNNVNQEYTLEYYPLKGHACYKTKETDYASFGVTLLDLYSGKVHFEGKTKAEIEAEWKNGLKIKEDIPLRMKELIDGLTHKKEEFRYGYREVNIWCNNGINIPRSLDRIEYVEETKIRPLIISIQGNYIEKVYTLDDMVQKMINQWEFVKKRFFGSASKNILMIEFIEQFNEQKASEVREIMNSENPDTAMLLIIKMFSELNYIQFKNNKFYSLIELVKSLEGDNVDHEFVNYIRKGLYRIADKDEYNRKISIEIDKCISMAEDNDDLLYYLIQKRFATERKLRINNDYINSPYELSSYVVEMGNKGIENIDFNSVYAWLCVNGCDIDMDIIKEILSSDE